jgi:hypothetical protein
MELVLKCTKSELNQALSKLFAKAGNLELKATYITHVKPNSAERLENYPYWKQMGFSTLEGRNALQ